MPRRSIALGSMVILAAVGSMIAGCEPTNLGECDPVAATTPIYFDEDGFPAYPGQALIDVSCGAARFCHAQGIEPVDRLGAPHGMAFDVAVAASPEEVDRLRYAIGVTRDLRHEVYSELLNATMPPGGAAGETALAAGARYRTLIGTVDERVLPSIEDEDAREIVRDWLSCGAPVIEATGEPSMGIGDVVPRNTQNTGPSCPSGQTLCGDICVDTAIDPANCGVCGESCGGRVCSGGACLDSCPAGTTDCGGRCVDLTTSEHHCGGCDVACALGSECAGGTCGCSATTRDCGGTCVNTATDPSNCGGCGIACAAGEGCSGGRCVGCGPAVAFAADIQPIFTARCAEARCHGGNRAAASLNLTAGRAWDELVGAAASCGSRPQVAPGDVEGSYLWSKLTGDGMCSGNLMPKAGQSLDTSDLDAIRSWICRGAPDN